MKFTKPEGTFWLAAALMVFGAAFRVLRAHWDLDFLPNFSPMMAIALCGGLYFSEAVAFGIAFPALVASDIALEAIYGGSFLSTGIVAPYACYALAILLGCVLRGYRSVFPAVLLGTLANTFLFYLVTNSAAWLSEAAYARSPAGWFQALTVGLPGYPPTWMFLRNSILGDVLFASLFYVVALRPRLVPKPAIV